MRPPSSVTFERQDLSSLLRDANRGQSPFPVIHGRRRRHLENSVLEDVLLLLMATLAVVVGLRRLRLPMILAFLIVGMCVGPHALGWVTPTETTETLAEFGIVFLLFALGLEFSLPRLIAMRGEVFTLGGLQVGGTTAAVAAVGWAIGLTLPVAILLGGAVAMSSTAIVLRQLTEQDELNRTHGRLAFGVLLFQDLAIVPFLALAGVLASPQEDYTTLQIALAVSKAAVALLIVLASGRWLLRPLFHEIAKSNAPELFTFAVLFVAIGAAWATHAVGLSFALGAFLAGMMLAETEYRYQVEAGIRPFRDTLLGLFFVTIGMQLDVPSLLGHLPVVIAILAGMLLLKAAIVMLAARPFAGEWFKSLRSGIVLSPGGEFGFALLALLLDNRLIGASFTQPLLAAITLSMLISPLLIRHNKSIARFVLRQSGPLQTGLDRLDAANQALARREHVILCGYGRVGQNVGRVLEIRGLRMPGDGPRPGARAHRARRGRRRDLRRCRRRGRAEVRRHRARDRGRGDLLRHRALARDRACGAARSARTCRSWCAHRTIRTSRTCSRPGPRKSCRRRWRPR